ncbi:MAG: GatB/YqeY domain-containing protein [Synergistaceae bacterium]|jgi:uncharacterized protein YqeY|nr:GatB/YqeY domain-containing protein [Synergistaceae bacterium]
MPSPLAELIQKDMVSAMKSHDALKLSVLRMLKTAIQLASTEKGREGELTDEDIQVLIRRGIKQREEAAEVYKNGGASDRAQGELDEARILTSYLPAQLGDEELESVVRKIAASSGASSQKDMGLVMSAAMKELSGRADGKRVKDAARRILAG